jgi:hypothetical protein
LWADGGALVLVGRLDVKIHSKEYVLDSWEKSVAFGKRVS